MPNIDFVCPNCNTGGKITLMGETHGNFEKKCRECAFTVELDVKNNNLINTKIKHSRETKANIKVPLDYKKYDFKEDKEKTKNKPFGLKPFHSWF